MDIILLRHTSSIDNEAGVFSRPDTGLSKKGLIEMDRLLLKDYPVEVIYSSPYKRSLVLAQILAQKLDLPLIEDPRLREIDFGLFEGRSFAEIEKSFPEEVEKWLEDPLSFRYPGGEAFSCVGKRARSFYKDLDRSSLIISHQALMFSLLAEVLGYDYKELAKLQMGSGARIHLKDQPWRLISLENL